MTIDDHWLHSINGTVYAERGGAAEARRVAELAYRTDRRNGIVLHFHGGLVNESSAQATAIRLEPEYTKAAAYPVFFVWHSGFMDTLRSNLREILGDSVFRELLIKVAQWCVKRGDGTVDGEGEDGMTDSGRIREDLEDYFAERRVEPPVHLTGRVQTTTKSLPPSEDQLASEIEQAIPRDQRFQEVMASLAVASGRMAPSGTKAAGFEQVPMQVLVDRQAIDAMFPTTDVINKGVLSWYAVAKFLAKAVFATVKRFRAGTDHGAYTTMVEEVLRAAYLAKVGQSIWREMKRDADTDTFNEPEGVGEIVLQRWKELFNEQRAAATGAMPMPPRVTLVGHSTGAIFINAWIARSAQLFPELTYDVIFLAPACTVDSFTDMHQRHQDKIKHFRMFGMLDENERRDRLVPVIYLRSLLYFVSGVVEGEPDIPIMGMHRYLSNTQQYGTTALGRLREFLHPAGSTVWSEAVGDTGLISASLSHGDFDNDPGTVSSVQHLVRNGF